jgi:hypothetical protein
LDTLTVYFPVGVKNRKISSPRTSKTHHKVLVVGLSKSHAVKANPYQQDSLPKASQYKWTCER